MRSAFRLVIPTLLSCSLGACGGGGGGGTGTPQATKLVLPLSFPFSGSMFPFGSFTQPTTGVLVVGDQYYIDDDYATRCFLSFELAPVPPGATIETAQIRMLGRVSTADDPYALMGFLKASHVDLGPAITLDDFDSGIPYTVPSIPAFPAGSAYGEQTFSVLESVRDDLQVGRPRTTLRLRFEAAPQKDGKSEQVEILVNPVNAAQRPVLEITYR